MPALHAATVCSALESCSGGMSFFCSASTDSRSASSICRISRPCTRMPSCGVMNISFTAFSASATANATLSELTRYVLPSPSKPKRRDDRDDALREQRLEHLHVHALDLAGEQMVHALDDAERMGDDDVRADGAEVVGRKPFENFVRQPVRGGQRELQRGRVRDARAVEVRGGNFLLLGEQLDLRRRAVDEHDADVQRAQHRHVQQQRGEVFVGDDRAVNREDERLLAELRNVLQDAPQVGRFHFSGE